MDNKTDCRITPIQNKDFKPFSLAIDVKTNEELQAFIELFRKWDDDIHELLLENLAGQPNEL